MTLQTSRRLAWLLNQPIRSHTPWGVFKSWYVLEKSIYHWLLLVWRYFFTYWFDRSFDLIFNISPVILCVICNGEIFSSSLFYQSVSTPGKTRPLCLTCLPVCHLGDISLDSLTGLEGESNVLFRDIHQQHKRNPLSGLQSWVSYLLLATAGTLEGLTPTVYRTPFYITENCNSLRFEDWWW